MVSPCMASSYETCWRGSLWVIQLVHGVIYFQVMHFISLVIFDFSLAFFESSTQYSLTELPAGFRLCSVQLCERHKNVPVTAMVLWYISETEIFKSGPVKTNIDISLAFYRPSDAAGPK